MVFALGMSANCAIDCYSLSPVGKFELIDAVTDNLGLRHLKQIFANQGNRRQEEPILFKVSRGGKMGVCSPLFVDSGSSERTPSATRYPQSGLIEN